MLDVPAMLQLLEAAPPRSAQLVRRAVLEGLPLEALAALYGVPTPQARVLLFRALLEVRGGPGEVLEEAEEAQEVAAYFGGGEAPRARSLRALTAAMGSAREALLAALARRAAEHEASPDRVREQWLRRAAIVAILALSAWFYWQERHRPLPPPEKRPVLPRR